MLKLFYLAFSGYIFEFFQDFLARLNVCAIRQEAMDDYREIVRFQSHLRTVHFFSSQIIMLPLYIP